MTDRLGKIITIILLAILNLPDSIHAQGKKPATLAELVAYTGADREQILAAGAKAEGKVIWYTSLAGSSYKELAQGFEKKYPGVKAEVYRAASNELLARIMPRRKRDSIWSTPSKPLCRCSRACAKMACWRFTIHRISQNIRPMPRREPAMDFTTGASIARASSASATIPTLIPPARCRRISPVCSIRSSRAKWVLPPAKPACA